MRRVVSAIVLSLLIGSSNLPQPALAVGVFTDAVDEVGFLMAPAAPVLTGGFTRSIGDGPDATLFTVDIAFPMRSSALVELQIPYIITERQADGSGFGDVLIRARARLYARPERVVHLISGLRTGSGTTLVYPYSSQSIDLELGVGYVDTLELFCLWGMASATRVSRAPESMPDNRKHGHFVRVGAGIEIPVSGGFYIGAGGMGQVYEAGYSREIYLGTLNYYRSKWLTFVMSAQAEGGRRDERVSDFALTTELRIAY